MVVRTLGQKVKGKEVLPPWPGAKMMAPPLTDRGFRAKIDTI